MSSVGVGIYSSKKCSRHVLAGVPAQEGFAPGMVIQEQSCVMDETRHQQQRACFRFLLDCDIVSMQNCRGGWTHMIPTSLQGAPRVGQAKQLNLGHP